MSWESIAFHGDENYGLAGEPPGYGNWLVGRKMVKLNYMVTWGRTFCTFPRPKKITCICYLLYCSRHTLIDNSERVAMTSLAGRLVHNIIGSHENSLVWFHGFLVLITIGTEFNQLTDYAMLSVVLFHFAVSFTSCWESLHLLPKMFTEYVLQVSAFYH